MKMLSYVRLPLRNAYNVRELGGYPCGIKQVTRWHTFLRGDDLSRLDSNDIRFLLNYGVSSVVDLRSPSEIEINKSPFLNHPNVNYVNISLIAADNVADLTKMVPDNQERFIPDLYIDMVKYETNAIKDIFNFMALYKEGCTLFHCAAGKDRTGIIAMLLQGLVGVSKADIIANYEVTYSYIRQNPMMQIPDDRYPVEVMYSRAEYLEPVIDYILNTSGSFAGYLRSIGLSDDTLGSIKDQFTALASIL